MFTHYKFVGTSLALLRNHSTPMYSMCINRTEQNFIKFSTRIYSKTTMEYSPIPRVSIEGSSFWNDYFKLAKVTDVINLASYMPDRMPSKFITNSLKCFLDSDDSSFHQYTKSSQDVDSKQVKIKLKHQETDRKAFLSLFCLCLCEIMANIFQFLNLTKDTFWNEYRELNDSYNALNLGVANTDSLPPKFVLDTLINVVKSEDASLHQCTKSSGHPRLAKILAKIYSKLIERSVDPNLEIMTTLGASEGLSCAIFSLITTGDEVIVIEPYFEPYVTLIQMAGGTPKFIALKPPESESTSSYDWTFDKNELQSLFSEKTKAIIVNTPNNPLGKVFSYSELEFIADLCKKWNVICIADEVYEWMVYEPKKHIRICSLPGMWDRTVTIGSAGKSFSITGWKVGWVYGSSPLIKSMQFLHQLTVFTGSTPLEETIACVLEREYNLLNQSESHFKKLRKELQEKRDYLVKILSNANFKPVIPDAGAFILVNWSDLESCADLSSETDEFKDFRFTKWLVKQVGVLGIPATPFFSNNNKKPMEKFLRLCFISKMEHLHLASTALSRINT